MLRLRTSSCSVHCRHCALRRNVDQSFTRSLNYLLVTYDAPCVIVIPSLEIQAARRFLRVSSDSVLLRHLQFLLR